MQKIDIKINTDATLEYTVSGVKGSSCKELTAAIDGLSKNTKGQVTGEYYETPVLNPTMVKN